jgi:hypothetical protein
MHHLRLVATVGIRTDTDPAAALGYLEVVSQADEPILWLTAKIIADTRIRASQLRASHSATVSSILDTQRAIAEARNALEEAQRKVAQRASARSLTGDVHWAY